MRRASLPLKLAIRARRPALAPPRQDCGNQGYLSAARLSRRRVASGEWSGATRERFPPLMV